jgi:hypothetical protein
MKQLDDENFGEISTFGKFNFPLITLIACPFAFLTENVQQYYERTTRAKEPSRWE